MFASIKSKTKSSARQQIAIIGVKDGILILPRREYRAILQVSPLNFELRSEDEQDVIIETYESFLNSIGMSLQILIRTREIDMDQYLRDLSTRLTDEPEQVYRDQLLHYDSFIRSLIKSNKILTRSFYVIIPYHARPNIDFDLIKEQLDLKLDIVSKGMLRIGMHARALSSLETLDLFYSFYSPAQSKLQPLTRSALELIHTTIVQKGTNL